MVKTLNIVLQIDESQHASSERVIINYLDEDENKTKIVDLSDLSSADEDKYNDFKEAMNALIN